MTTSEIQTKNGKKFKVETTDNKFFRVTSVENPMQTKACGELTRRGLLGNIVERVSGYMTPMDVAEYLSERSF